VTEKIKAFLFEYFPNGSQFMNIIRPRESTKNKRKHEKTTKKKKMIIVLISLKFATSRQGQIQKGAMGAIAPPDSLVCCGGRKLSPHSPLSLTSSASQLGLERLSRPNSRLQPPSGSAPDFRWL